jgi:hypothetical protein
MDFESSDALRRSARYLDEHGLVVIVDRDGVVGCSTNSARPAWTIAGLDALAVDDQRAAAADATLRLTSDAKSFGAEASRCCWNTARP